MGVCPITVPRQRVDLRQSLPLLCLCVNTRRVHEHRQLKPLTIRKGIFEVDEDEEELLLDEEDSAPDSLPAFSLFSASLPGVLFSCLSLSSFVFSSLLLKAARS